MKPEVSVILWAAASRGITVALSVVANLALPDHQAEGVDYFSPQEYHTAQSIRASIFQTFTRWDAAHFLNIASQGYLEEHQYAFFPLYPFLVSKLAAGLRRLALGFTYNETLVFSAVVLSNACFVVAALGLYRLGSLVLLNRRMAFQGGLLFCFTPASVFFSSGYCGSLYAMLTFWGMYFFFRKNRFVGACLLSLATCTRSNGILMTLVIGFEQLRRILNSWTKAVESKHQPQYLSLLLWVPLETLLLALLIMLPYFAFQWHAYHKFCSTQGAVSPEWCHYAVPSIYSHIQDKYWNVGFLKYWQLKQIPNFLLAAPAIYLWQRETLKFFRLHWRWCFHSLKSFNQSIRYLSERDSLPRDKLQKHSHHLQAGLLGMYVQWTLLTLMGIFVINVQVLTRLAAGSCPCFYWALSSFFDKSQRTSSQHEVAAVKDKGESLVIIYCSFYIIIGITLHSNFLPWT